MGFLMSKPMEEMGKKQQELMQAQLERQLAMQNLMRERMMAMQVARTKEMLNWTGPIGTLLMTMLCVGAFKKQNPAMAIPILPISGVLGYQIHLAYGGKMRKIQRYAETMLIEQPELFDLPLGAVTPDDVEKTRMSLLKNRALYPNQVFL